MFQVAEMTLKVIPCH